MGALLMAAEGTSLSPEELDRLEDALERWTEPTFEPGPEDSLLADPLRERLAGYREVLAATREALPLEDVGDDVLAAVLAEAHRSQPPRRAEKQGPGWFERLRRSLLLPGVALAGSAALLLWLVQPSPELSLTAADDAPAAREEARLAPEAGPAPAAPQEPASAVPEAESPGRGADAAKGEARADPSSAAGAAVPKDMEGGKSLDRKPAKPMVRKSDAPADAPLPGLDDDAAVEEADKQDLRDTLDRAHDARHAGDCEAAMSGYLAAMKMAGAATERAQARAGYAVCLQQRGNEADAAKYIDYARKLWSGTDAWLSKEGAGELKKSKSKLPPKPKKSVADPMP
ncbi:MAG: hypothetical protein JNL82_05580 [Myxococcales bacterium]|nr:hypothetical protein [Myxococcales bacterium]